MKTSRAHFISTVFNPLFLLLFMPLVLVYYSTGDVLSAMHWTAYSAFFLLLIVAVVVYGVQKGTFSDLDVSKREQRPLLFLLTIIIAMLYLAGLFVFQAPLVLFLTIFALMVGTFLASIMNVYLKASLHVAVITGLTITLTVLYKHWYTLLLLLIPLVAWSRITIKRHTFIETIAGAVLGSLLSLGMYAVIKFFFNS